MNLFKKLDLELRRLEKLNIQMIEAIENYDDFDYLIPSITVTLQRIESIRKDIRIEAYKNIPKDEE